MITGHFSTYDNKRLFYRKWMPQEANGRVICLLHRGHEHSGRLEDVTAHPVFAGYTIYAYDYRGHGQSPAPATGEFMDLVRDLDTFVRFVCKQENIGPDRIFVIANSVSGVVTSTWVHDYAPGIAGMALVAPAFRIRLYVPFALPLLRLATRFMPGLNISSYVRSGMLTHDERQQELYDNDNMITREIPVRQLVTLDRTARRIVADASVITVPTLVLSAGRDYVVDSAVQGDFFVRLSSPLKSFVPLEGLYHAILYERDTDIAINAIATFMEQAFEHVPEPSLQRHDLVRVMERERDRIAHGSVGFCRRNYFRFQRVLLRSVGRLSKGIRIGMRYGFDSGVTLDHVYENRPSGTTVLGRIIDRYYLDSVGWAGIRTRKENLVVLIEEKIRALVIRNQQVRILDIAGGPARYLVELAEKYPDIRVVVRDYQKQNIVRGRELASRAGVENISYQQVDALDGRSYEDDSFKPNIIIVSGLFELFGDNGTVAVVIRGLARIIANDGYLVYTGQPWHPQLEYIARVLGNHRRKPWIMRRRSTCELDSLFAEFGFVKEQMRMDDQGIFTVSVARPTMGGTV